MAGDPGDDVRRRPGLAGGLRRRPDLGVAGLGNALGPLIGGVLTDETSWRAIFFLNIPVAAFAVAVTWARSTSRSTTRRASGSTTRASSRSPRTGAAAAALDQSADWGWGDPRVLGMIASPSPLSLLSADRATDGRSGACAEAVIRNRGFTAACLTILFLSAVFFSAILYVPQLMEKILGYSALKAG